MKETDIRNYAKLMSELGLTGLEITDDNQKVRLERNVSAPAETVGSVAAIPQSAKPVQDDGCVSVKSQLVGVFYASPTENSNPYVNVGDHVKKGQVICIIEAMKLMNEITAEENGVIEEVCVTNGQVVEYGTKLFSIRRA